MAQQNLVPNPSFEQFVSCPQFGVGEICLVEPWFDATTSCSGSTDIFTPCTAPFSGGGAPANFTGYQNAHFGFAYCGIVSVLLGPVLPSDIGREYLELKLIEPLINERNYCVHWFSSLGDESRYGTNRIGAYFSLDTLYQTGSQFDYIDVDPHIESLYINNDTMNWTSFHQSFMAQGGEQFMTVGNFQPGVMVDTSDVINPSGIWAYYYFDDFSVYLLPEVDAGLNDSIYGYETTILNGSCVDCWNGLQFTWEPSEDFEDPHSLTAQVSPDVTTTYYLTVQDTTGTVPCMDEVRDSVTIYVKNGPDFIVFPNPSFQDAPVKVYIGNVGGGSLTIRVHDIKGKLIYEKLDVKPLSTHELDLKLSAGMYTVTLNSEVKIVETKKLIIEE